MRPKLYGAVALGYQISIFNNRTNLIIRSFLEKISPNPAESQIKLKQNPHASTTENATQKRNATLVPMVNQGAPLPFDASYRKRRLCWSRVLLRGTIVNRTHGTHKNQTLSPKRKNKKKKVKQTLSETQAMNPEKTTKKNQEKAQLTTQFLSNTSVKTSGPATRTLPCNPTRGLPPPTRCPPAVHRSPDSS